MKKTTDSKEQKKPRILIADDHEIYRTGLTLFLEHEEMQVIEYATTGREAVINTIKHEPDFLILDIAMPDLDGLIALTIVKFLLPEIRVVVLTALPDSLYMSQALDLGADGYFSKGVDNDMIVDFIRSLNDKDEDSKSTVSVDDLSTELERKSSLKRRALANEELLTNSERSILRLISEGVDRQIIAKEMEISRATLSVHMSKIFTKLAITDRNPEEVRSMFDKFESN